MNKKDLIIYHAIREIASQGFYNAKMHTIAENAGIAVGTIYRYFRNKEELLYYIFTVEFDKLIKCLEIIEQNDGDCLKKFEKFLNIYYSQLSNNPDFVSIVVRQGMMPIRQTSAIETMTTPGTKFQNLIEKGQKEGSLNKNINSYFGAFMILHMMPLGVFGTGYTSDKELSKNHLFTGILKIMKN